MPPWPCWPLGFSRPPKPVTHQMPQFPLSRLRRRATLPPRAALVDAGADVNAAQSDGATALHWAAYREDLETAALLIQAGADVNAANDLGVTPLLMACTNGHADLVEALLAAGADPNAALPSGETPLLAASRAGSPGAVESLLATRRRRERRRADAGPDAADVGRRQPACGGRGGAHCRRRRHQRALARSATAYTTWAATGPAGSASSVIPLEEVAIGGSTPLLFAARSGDVESARLLLDSRRRSARHRGRRQRPAGDCRAQRGTRRWPRSCWSAGRTSTPPRSAIPPCTPRCSAATCATAAGGTPTPGPACR